eukprot:scaffold13315_cov26-Tisochrysis_lutea.AAC.1
METQPDKVVEPARRPNRIEDSDESNNNDNDMGVCGIDLTTEAAFPLGARVWHSALGEGTIKHTGMGTMYAG